MRPESIRRRIDDAASALRRGDTNAALTAADEIVAADPTSADGQQVRAIALTRLGDLGGATDAFRKAAALAPDEPKHFYNLAVNLRDRNLIPEAVENATIALRLDPAHVGAQRLLIELGAAAPLEEVGEPTPGQAIPVRTGYGEPIHLLPFLNGMERAWTLIGGVFLAMDALLAILMLVHLPMTTTGLLMPHSKVPDVELRHDNLSMFIVFLYLVSWISTFMWMFVDIIDLRRRFSWLVPFIACSIPGYSVVPMALYMTIGRRFEKIGVT